MSKTKKLQEVLNALRLSATANELSNHLEKAKEEQPAYVDFLHNIFKHEVKIREERAYERRMTAATFPYVKTLNEFSLDEQASMSKQQFNQLKSLDWVDQSYNLILLGPTGVGKTMLSVGLGIKAVDQGFKVVFVTMGEMIRLLKTQEITSRSAQKIKRMKDSHMIILDDLMFMALSKQEANLFFHFINEVYETTSIVLTSNKAPTEWGQLIGDEIITAAILDRIVQKSEIIHLSGESYRVKHRQTIFDHEESID
jgi:DNA replication protein DnaC